MVKDLTLKGLVLGTISGLLVTLFDGFYMLIPNIYVPLSYPLLLIIFNTLFWMTVGGLSGFTLGLFVHKRGDFQAKDNFYWVIFFLFPFVMIYGLLGRVYIPPSVWFVNFGKPVFDHHLSFLWSSVILACLILYLRKIGNRIGGHSLFFALEIVTFIMLFQFCSNLSYIKIPRFYSSHQNLFQNIRLELGQFLIAVYVLGVLSIAGLYCIARFKIRPFTKGEPGRRNYFTIIILFFIVSGWLTGLFAWSNKRHIKEEFPAIAARQNKEEVKVSHVILIVLDTVRANRLSIYGNPGASKNLEVFSRDALVFENCFAPSPWTTPSHASLFTGLYPTEHGSHGILDSKKKDTFGLPMTYPLSEECVTLAEIFRDNGYRTCAVVSNSVLLSPYLKLDQGFQISDNSISIGRVYNQYSFRPILHLFCYLTNVYPKYTLFYKTADEITSQSTHLLEKLPSPIFLFINYLDAHGPYSPPRPFSGYFLNTPFPHFQRLKQYFLRLVNSVNEKTRDAYQLSQYDGEIAYLDNELGRFFSQLKRMGIYDSSLIIITSDHGELFGEHGLYWHRTHMYEEVVRIPLLIKFPFSKRIGREKRMITLADLYPTILSICELPIPTTISGKAFGDTFSPIVAELYEFETGEHRVLYEGKYKYMRYDHKKGPELYDLQKDPLEKEDLAEKLPEVSLAMEEKLKHWKKAHGPKHSPPTEKERIISKELVEELKALGYIQ